jgi:hypothetical protein
MSENTVATESAETTDSGAATVVATNVTLESAVSLYVEGNSADRGIVRKTVNANMLAALKSGDLATAQGWAAVLPQLRVTRESTAATVNPADVLNDRIVTLFRAVQYLAYGDCVPDGLDVSEVDYARFAPLFEGMRELADKVELSLTGDESDAAQKIASARITKSVEKHDIGEVVRRAFDAAPDRDTLKPTEIAKLGATEDYRPGTGAISARFTAGKKTGVDGFVWVPADASGPARIRRA